ncbi:MAG: hypothetical protein AAF721_18315 [Myxococcota bacterium]
MTNQRSPFLPTCIGALTLCLAPTPATASGGQGHADKSHKVVFSDNATYDFWVHTGTCRVARDERGDGRRVEFTNTHKLTDASTLDSGSCRSGQSQCFFKRNTAGSITRHNSGSILSGHNVEQRVELAVGQCSKFMHTSNAQRAFDWSGANNANVQLSSANDNDMGRIMAREDTYTGARVQEPNGAWSDTRRITKIGRWSRGVARGLCRVRFFGADYFGTIRPRDADGGDTYRWSSSAHRYVETNTGGNGDQCHVRIIPNYNSGNGHIVRFKQFDVVRTPQSHRWAAFEPGGSVPSGAIPVGFHRSNPVYACRIIRETEVYNHTRGVRIVRREPFLGWYRHGTHDCVTPEPYDQSGKPRRGTALLQEGI